MQTTPWGNAGMGRRLGAAVCLGTAVCLAALLSPWLPGTLSSHAATVGEACPPPPSAESGPLAREPTTVPTSQPAPEQILVCVGPQPITGATYRHWETIAEASGSAGPPAKHHQPNRAVVSQVMGFLISADWVIGEARDLDVTVSAVTVRHKFDRLRHAQFPRAKQFKAFLRETRQTVPDLLLRVELNLLSERIQKHVLAGHHGVRNQKRALLGFVSHFRHKWEAQTYCNAQYATRDCGHVQATV